MKNLLNWIVFFSVISFIGCSVAKKNQRAVNRVKADINLLNDVGDAWQKLHPCAPVGSVIIPGQTITVIDSSFAKENIEILNKVIDSLLDKNCPVENIDSLKKAVKRETERSFKPVIIYKNKTDTLPDRRAEQIALDKINNLEGQNAQLKTENAGLKKEGNKKMWWLIGISLFAFFSIGGLTYLLFKK